MLLSKVKETVIKYLLNSYKSLIIFHWDVDGISSASILRDYLASKGVDVSLYVPKIGIYGIEGIDINKVKEKEADLIILLDYSLRINDLRKIEEKLGVPVIVIDHHLNPLPKKLTYLNPLIYGYTNSEYPSTTWVLKKCLEIPIDLRVALGVLGDKDDLVLSEVRNWVRVQGLNINSLTTLVSLINSCYKVMDKLCVAYSVIKLSLYGNNINQALIDTEWREVSSKVDEELNKLLLKAKAKVVDDVIQLYQLNSKYLLTSAIGRALAKNNPDKIVVLILKVRDFSYIYVRSMKYNLVNALKQLMKLKLNVGGKEDVFSILLKQENTNVVIKKVINVIKNTVLKQVKT